MSEISSKRKNEDQSGVRSKRVQRTYSVEDKLKMIKLRQNNMSFADIARLLDVPVTTVKTIFTRRQNILEQVSNEGKCDPKTSPEQIIISPEPETLCDTDIKPTFLVELNNSLNIRGYSARQVFNVTVTSLNWNLQVTTSTVNSKSDVITLLLGANAQGDFKIKPLLVNHLENPPELLGKNKALLPVIWNSNPNISITNTILSNWFNCIFKPKLKNYLMEQNLEFKSLLLIDDSLKNVCCNTMIAENPDIEIMFVPAKQCISQSVLPMLKVLSVFEHNYTHRLMTQAVSSIDIGECSDLHEFKNKYNIWKATYGIADSWADVKPACINGAWSDLCPQFVLNEGEMSENEQIDKNIFELRKRLLLVENTKKTDCENNVTKNYEMNIVNISEIAIKRQQLFDLIKKEDPNKQRAAKIIRNVERELSCYFQEDNK